MYDAEAALFGSRAPAGNGESLGPEAPAQPVNASAATMATDAEVPRMRTVSA